jgi:heptosyltransferase-3
MSPDQIPLNDLRRVLVIKLRHHGDVLLSSPVFSVLKRHAPQAEIDALVYADTAPMLTLHPAIARVHGVDRNWKRLGAFARLSAELALFNRLRERRYDLVVHLTEHPRGAWLARLLGARHAVGPRIASKPKFWRTSFTRLYAQPLNARRHMVERNLDALRCIGIQPGADERRLTLVPGTDAEARVATLLAQHGLAGKDFIHFHPASRWLFKCWSVEKNAELMRCLEGAGERVVVTCAPDAGEMEFMEAMLGQAGPRVVNLAGQLSLKELGALAQRARLFVGVDSAPMHIAAAMGTPVAVLFGPSGELEWGPWGVPNRVIASEAHPCRPCGIDGCGGSKVSECLTTLPVARVMAAIGELLALSPDPSPARGRGV